MRPRDRLREQQFDSAGFENGGDQASRSEYGKAHAGEVEDHRDYALSLLDQVLDIGAGKTVTEDGDRGERALDDVHAEDEDQKQEQGGAAAKKAPEDAAGEGLPESVANQGDG